MTASVQPIEALVEDLAGGGWLVRSPGVGIFRSGPRAGARRTAGDPVGRLTLLNRVEELVLPAGVEGVVRDVATRPRMEPVEYAQPLFSLAPFPAGEAVPHPPGLVLPPDSLVPGAGGGIPAGCFGVMCPIEGVFYRSPSPGAAAFVQPGEAIQTGRTLGLVEAMKSFNAVIYGAAGLPARAEVVEVRARDGAEVAQGSVLFVLKPLA